MSEYFILVCRWTSHWKWHFQSALRHGRCRLATHFKTISRSLSWAIASQSLRWIAHVKKELMHEISSNFQLKFEYESVFFGSRQVSCGVFRSVCPSFCLKLNRTETATLLPDQIIAIKSKSNIQENDAIASPTVEMKERFPLVPGMRQTKQY